MRVEVMDGDRFIGFVVWVLSLVVAIVFVYNGISKIGGSAPQVAQFEALGIPTSLMFTVGVLEIFGALFLTLPRLYMVGCSLLCLIVMVFAALHFLNDDLASLPRSISIGLTLVGICYLRFKHPPVKS